jgi:hypothetical protein
VRTRLFAANRRALLPILIAGALSVGASAAAGIAPSSPKPIPGSAFTPVTLDAGAATPSTQAGGPARVPDVAPIADPWLNVAPPAERARPSLPASQPIAVAKPVAPKTSHSISGRASWYCDAGVSPCTVDHPDTSGFDAYAAAGPRLRAAIGSGWRGKVVYVDGVRVKLIDWCQCYQGESNEKLLDLYHDVFLRTGSSVTIRW